MGALRERLLVSPNHLALKSQPLITIKAAAQVPSALDFFEGGDERSWVEASPCGWTVGIQDERGGRKETEPLPVFDGPGAAVKRTCSVADGQEFQILTSQVHRDGTAEKLHVFRHPTMFTEKARIA